MPSVADAVRSAPSVISGIDSIAERERLLDLVRKLEDSEAEVRDLRRRNEALAVQLARRKDLERMGAAYFIIERDGTRTGPLCPHCYREDGIVILLESSPRKGAACASCSRVYRGVETPLEHNAGRAG